MITLLTTMRNAASFRFFLKGYGASLASDFRQMTYNDALAVEPATLSRGTWIFCDFDVLPPRSAYQLSRLWRRLADRGDRMLNHPTRSMRRFELLRTLNHLGINDHDVYLAADPRPPRRFPVFVRAVDTHSGPLSRLLPDEAALGAYLDGTHELGWPREGLIVVEHRDMREPSGVVRSYAAMRVGDCIIPDHLWFSDSWMIKERDAWQLARSKVDIDALRREEMAYLTDNPHADQLRRIFDIARIDYGRIDYGMRDGRIAVWEINSNPEISDAWNAVHESYRERVRTLFGERLVSALREIDRR